MKLLPVVEYALAVLVTDAVVGVVVRVLVVVLAEAVVVVVVVATVEDA